MQEQSKDKQHWSRAQLATTPFPSPPTQQCSDQTPAAINTMLEKQSKLVHAEVESRVNHPQQQQRPYSPA